VHKGVGRLKGPKKVGLDAIKISGSEQASGKTGRRGEWQAGGYVIGRYPAKHEGGRIQVFA